MIRCFQNQDYTGDIEWIIIDDGTDSIEDLVSHLPHVKYVRLDTKHTIGKKRNMSHELSKGDILIYMDDDDYYPPNRISHAVDKLTHSDALCAGSSIIHVYFDHIKKIVEFGPYGQYHATAGTFALKRELLKYTSYHETATMAEEKHFLKNYTIPMVQLDPIKTILVVSHAHNTFDKKKVLKPGAHVRESHLQMEDFIQEETTLQFFKTDIHPALETYTVGRPKNETREFTVEEATRLIKAQQQRIQELTEKIRIQQQQINRLMKIT